MFVYRVYDDEDPAQSDQWFPTKREALAYAKECERPSEIRRYEIKPNRRDVCDALNYLPMR
jgi:hypothetical protein